MYLIMSLAFLSSVLQVMEDPSCVLHAVMEGNKKKLLSLLKNGASVNDSDDAEMTPLMWASLHNNLDLVELLLQYACDINQVCLYGLSALHYAARQGHVKCMHILLQAGAETEICAMEGGTPLVFAVQKGHLDCIAVLIRQGASLRPAKNNLLCSAMLAGEQSQLVEVRGLAKLNMEDKGNLRNRF